MWKMSVLQLEESLMSISESGFDLRVYERKNYSDLGLREAYVLKQKKGEDCSTCVHQQPLRKEKGSWKIRHL